MINDSVQAAQVRTRAGASHGPVAPADTPTDPKDVTFVILGTGDVTTSGPMGMALQYLATSGKVADNSVKIVSGPPAPGRPADTQAAFMGRIQTGRVPLTPDQLAGYEKMTGLNPASTAPLPSADVTNPQSLVDTLTPLIAGSKKVVVYFGLPPVTFDGGLDSMVALQKKFPNTRIVTLLEKPFGKSAEAAQALEAKSTAEFAPGDVLSIDHFLAYPGNLAAKKLLGQPMFQEALDGRYVDHGTVRMDEGPAFVGADRPYMRGLGQDAKTGRNHGGVAEDMFQSHGWVGLLTPVLGDVLGQVHIDPASVTRAQVDTFNSPEVLKDSTLQPSDAATRVTAGFTVDTPAMKGVPWVMWANKGVAIEPDEGKTAPPKSWFGTQLHFKALPPALAQHLSEVSGQPITPGTTGTLSIRANSDPKVSFKPDNGGPEIQLLSPKDVAPAPPEATLLLDAGAGRTENFSNAHLENEGWHLTNQITDQFSNPQAPGYVPLGTYPLNADVRTLNTPDPRL